MARLIPELNIKINFKASAQTIANAVGTGCQASTMSAVHLMLSHPALEWIDPKQAKNKAVYYKQDDYGRTRVEPVLLGKILQNVKDNPITFEDHSNVNEEVVTRCGHIPLWFISDVANANSEARGNATLASVQYISGDTVLPMPKAQRSYDFVQHLKKNKIGYILETPIIQNPLHRMSSNYSLNMAWVWIPPAHLARAHGFASEYGEDQIPVEKDWIKTIAADLKLEPEQVLENVFKDGIMPERRFIRDIRKPKMSKAA